MRDTHTNDEKERKYDIFLHVYNFTRQIYYVPLGRLYGRDAIKGMNAIRALYRLIGTTCSGMKYHKKFNSLIEEIFSFAFFSVFHFGMFGDANMLILCCY